MIDTTPKKRRRLTSTGFPSKPRRRRNAEGTPGKSIAGGIGKRRRRGTGMAKGGGANTKLSTYMNKRFALKKAFVKKSPDIFHLTAKTSPGLPIKNSNLYGKAHVMMGNKNLHLNMDVKKGITTYKRPTWMRKGDAHEFIKKNGDIKDIVTSNYSKKKMAKRKARKEKRNSWIKG